MADSGQFYLSRDGDVLDSVVHSFYGDTRGGKVEAVIAANPGLAEHGAVLGIGHRIFLPPLEPEQPVDTLQLWG